jgi:hypothetical protein
VPLPDEERFEAYLKQFRPLVPEQLPTSGSRHRAPNRFVLWAGAAAGVAILVGAAALHIHTRRVRLAETASSPATADPFTDRQPLTMRTANTLIVKAPSFKALVDGMAFRSQTLQAPKGKLSAVAVLSKEKIKL